MIRPRLLSEIEAGWGLEPDDARTLLNRLTDAEAEVTRLREALAYEARVVEAHYEGYKTFPKTRRKYAEEQVERMRRAALGDWPYYGVGYFSRSLQGLKRDAALAPPVPQEDPQ